MLAFESERRKGGLLCSGYVKVELRLAHERVQSRVDNPGRVERQAVGAGSRFVAKLTTAEVKVVVVTSAIGTTVPPLPPPTLVTE